MSLRLYGITNCDTVKRARAWLTQQGIVYEFHDFKKLGVPSARLPTWADAVGLATLINRQGTAWRKLEEAQRQSAEDLPGALALLSAHASVIKRPLVEWPDGRVSVGFDPADWAHRLSLPLG
jgi:Spx/MgsR family transcriptional regulator